MRTLFFSRISFLCVVSFLALAACQTKPKTYPVTAERLELSKKLVALLPYEELWHTATQLAADKLSAKLVTEKDIKDPRFVHLFSYVSRDLLMGFTKELSIKDRVSYYYATHFLNHQLEPAIAYMQTPKGDLIKKTIVRAVELAAEGKPESEAKRILLMEYGVDLEPKSVDEQFAFGVVTQGFVASNKMIREYAMTELSQKSKSITKQKISASFRKVLKQYGPGHFGYSDGEVQAILNDNSNAEKI